MADDDQFNIDTDSEDVEEEESDDDTGFFPIDEPIGFSSQTNNVTTTLTSSEQYSTTLGASNNYPKDNNFEYVVLSQDKIVKYMVECIKVVNEVIKLSSTTVRLLLHHFR